MRPAYLDHDRVLAALRAMRADAVWPGWGFLAEDPSFVEKLEAADLVFLGPSATTMRRLGDKITSKLIAEAARVPVSPWSGGPIERQHLAEQARRIGYPVMLKATAGGGGRGIRMLRDGDDVLAAFDSAQSEAANAFGDGTLFVEQMISGARHVEVQMAADRHGTVLALGLRDCSVQRKHQKVVEEGPPPGLSKRLVEQLREASIRLLREAHYVGVATCEYLVLAKGGEESFYFLEVNPRLQVEHGVTELLTDFDLVKAQIRIARGERLPTEAPPERGCAIEVRLCAEDPAAVVRAEPRPHRAARSARGPGRPRRRGHRLGRNDPVRVRLDDRQDPRARRDARRGPRAARARGARCARRRRRRDDEQGLPARRARAARLQARRHLDELARRHAARRGSDPRDRGADRRRDRVVPARAREGARELLRRRVARTAARDSAVVGLGARPRLRRTGVPAADLRDRRLDLPHPHRRKRRAGLAARAGPVLGSPADRGPPLAGARLGLRGRDARRDQRSAAPRALRRRRQGACAVARASDRGRREARSVRRGRRAARDLRGDEDGDRVLRARRRRRARGPGPTGRAPLGGRRDPGDRARLRFGLRRAQRGRARSARRGRSARALPARGRHGRFRARELGARVGARRRRAGAAQRDAPRPDGLRRESRARGTTRLDPGSARRGALRRAARRPRPALGRGRDLRRRRDALLARAHAPRRGRARSVERCAHGDVSAAHRGRRRGHRPRLPRAPAKGARALRDHVARALGHARARRAAPVRDAHDARPAQPADRRAPALADRSGRARRGVRAPARARARARRALAAARNRRAERRRPGRAGALPALRPRPPRGVRAEAGARARGCSTRASTRPTRRSSSASQRRWG